jgi:phosphatidylserine decarboxylase
MNIIDSIKTSVITPIHPAGIPFIAIFFVFTVIIGWLWSPLYFVGLVLTLWCVYFFRNPERITPVLSGANKNNLIISPADGRVIEISKVTPYEEIGLPDGNWTRVCVFMNVFDVHVNRSPMSGQITYKNYIPGAFLNASLDKASSDNERLILGMDTENGKKIAFVQIAGISGKKNYL